MKKYATNALKAQCSYGQNVVYTEPLMSYTEVAPSAECRALIAELLRSTLPLKQASWDFMNSSSSSTEVWVLREAPS